MASTQTADTPVRAARKKRWPWRWSRTATVLAVVLVLENALLFTRPGFLAAVPLGLLLFGFFAVVPALIVAGSVYLRARRRGWRLVGPHLFYDPGRLARRGRITALRVLFLAVLLFGLAWTYEQQPVILEISTMSQITQRYTFTFFVLQNMTIMLLTPVYVGGAIAEEKERRSLEVLFTTPMRSWEIVLGVLGGRLFLLTSFTLGALPILALLQLWGGVDMPLMLGNEINSLLLLLAVGSVCMLASVLAPTAIWGVVASYGLLLLPFFFCGAMAAMDVGSPFVLFDDRAGATGRLTVQNHLLPLAVCYLIISMICLALSILSLRSEHIAVVDVATAQDPRLFSPASRLVAAPAATVALPEVPSRETAPEEPRALGYLLPPIGENALQWKECFAGGPALIFTPFASSFLVLFLLYGIPFFLADATREARLHVLEFYYGAFLVFYLGGAVLRATASVARERERQTLDMLLQIPDEARVILWAKWYGAFWKGWPWLVLVLANVVGGLALGLYAPLVALWKIVSPWPLLLLLVSFALLLSVVIPTVLRARMTWMIVSLAVAAFLSRALADNSLGRPDVLILGQGLQAGADIWQWLLIAIGWQGLYLAGAAGACWLAAVRFAKR